MFPGDYLITGGIPNSGRFFTQREGCLSESNFWNTKDPFSPWVFSGSDFGPKSGSRDQAYVSSGVDPSQAGGPRTPHPQYERTFTRRGSGCTQNGVTEEISGPRSSSLRVTIDHSFSLFLRPCRSLCSCQTLVAVCSPGLTADTTNPEKQTKTKTVTTKLSQILKKKSLLMTL